MRTLALLLPTLSFLAASPLAFAQSPSTLLEGVKHNPEEAREMCKSFQTMNAAGKSALTPEFPLRNLNPNSRSGSTERKCEKE